eukprot:6188144-Pleurochrysis_carterae.AAC.4
MEKYAGLVVAAVQRGYNVLQWMMASSYLLFVYLCDADSNMFAVLWARNSCVSHSMVETQFCGIVHELINVSTRG